MTRASTPGSLSTRTAIACRSSSATPGGSNENHALLRDRLLGLVLGPEQHLVVGGTGGDHREAILGRVDRDVENYGAVNREHLADRRVDFSRALHPQPDRTEGFRQLDEI